MTRLTVLGSCGAWPEPGRACTGFLLSHNGFNFVIDLGYGTASRLLTHTAARDVDAVVITHEHPDHMADLSALGRAWHYTVQAPPTPTDPGEGARHGQTASRPLLLPLFCTTGTLRRLEATEPHPHPTTIFDVRDLSSGPQLHPAQEDSATQGPSTAPERSTAPEHGATREPGAAQGLSAARQRGAALELGATPEHGAAQGLGSGWDVGPFQLTAVLLPHHVPNHGVRLSAPGLSVVYSGDCGPSRLLVELARGADLLICEATLQGEPPADEPRQLMTAAEAGRAAAEAKVGTLLLTHFWPGTDRAVSVAEARAEFPGDVLAADEGLTLAL
ncbi:MBL fold metallo-hydrolase [Amycolatopsis saalfeldensis]|uniref:Ribonuclease BN, tRNA processing enzyme n=1 Tax=Amycolatopsis saalfeldensis TaxID=394193 RepID=A0A1H8YI09_9PSEU|nr:MBL fold metallo-hydrolase [Amycolatopsis saalfeldensis]SEP51799.1 Ribonuclease BN, tRNA processing enzyme [Amycolatopsis saalfeldensis]